MVPGKTRKVQPQSETPSLAEGGKRGFPETCPPGFKSAPRGNRAFTSPGSWEPQELSAPGRRRRE